MDNRPDKKSRSRGPRNRRRRRKERDFDQVLVDVARVARVMKGGRRFGFRTTVVIGDRKGKVGMGVARGADVSSAINKAVAKAKKDMAPIPIINGTIPHEINFKYGGARVFLKPASPGTGIIAGGGVRAVAELGGIKDLLSKMLGSASKVNNVRATLLALRSLKTPRQIASGRDKDLKEIMPARFRQPDKREMKKAVKKTDKAKTEKVAAKTKAAK